MTTWLAFVSSCARDVFTGKLVGHLSNSVTILVASSGVGTMKTRFQVCVQLALRTLNGASSSRSFAGVHFHYHYHSRVGRCRKLGGSSAVGMSVTICLPPVTFANVRF